VAVLLSDEAGNIMRAAAAGTIVLDTQPPAAARLVVNHGMPTVWTNNLALEVSGTDLTGITDMCVTDNPAAATPGAACPAGFEPFVASRAWQLALGGDGPHKVRVWLSDGLGHVTPAPAEATFVLDTLSATRAITINAGARFTASKAVNVSVAVPARGVDASGSLLVCISETATTPADCKGSDWQPYGKVRAFVLKSSSQGVRRLRAFLRDAQANVSAGGAETTIVYDSMPPTTNVKALNFSAAAISRNAATLAFNASATVDAVSGVTTFLVVGAKGATPSSRCAVSPKTVFTANVDAPGTGSGESAGTRVLGVRGLEAGTQYKFRLCATDAAGNVAPGATLTVRTLP
jgi:hypothetical protein